MGGVRRGRSQRREGSEGKHQSSTTADPRSPGICDLDSGLKITRGGGGDGGRGGGGGMNTFFCFPEAAEVVMSVEAVIKYPEVVSDEIFIMSSAL